MTKAQTKIILDTIAANSPKFATEVQLAKALGLPIKEARPVIAQAIEQAVIGNDSRGGYNKRRGRQPASTPKTTKGSGNQQELPGVA